LGNEGIIPVGKVFQGNIGEGITLALALLDLGPQRGPPKVVAIALANKIARMTWADDQGRAL
jgi:hypothetical protein